MLTALTIGNFDGVHRGHRALVEKLVAWKHRQPDPFKVKICALTFDPHPSEVLRPGTKVPRLSSLNERIHLLKNIGVDEVQVLPFNLSFSQKTAEDFFREIILEAHHPAYIVVGHNFYFGHARGGSPGKLLDWCQQNSIEAEILNPIEADGELVSSSRIRKLIQEGQMIPAARLLGRDYTLSGEVVYGDQRGRQLGFPTANIQPVFQQIGAPCLPLNGVYLSSCTVEAKTFPSITNVGVKPTIEGQRPINIETHLLNFEGDLYGKLLSVEFRDRLRSEQKFNSLEELRLQIQQDITLARERISLK